MDVVMTHELCPICLKQQNEQILLSKVELKGKKKEEFLEMHNKALGFSNPCEECQKNIDNNYYAFVGIDPDKSKELTLDKAYRTGDLIWLKDSFIKNNNMEIDLENLPLPLIFTDKDFIETMKSIHDSKEQEVEE